jgi:hypothetical protein
VRWKHRWSSHRSPRFVVSAGLVFLGLLIASPAAGALSPETLARAPTPIHAFAQDSGIIAWQNGRPDFDLLLKVHIRRIRTGAQANFGPIWGADPALGLARRRALWSDTSCGNFCEQQIQTGALDDPVVTVLEEGGWDSWDFHRSLPAGDGDDLVYASYTVWVCDEDPEGNWLYAAGGDVSRVVGTSLTPIPDAGGSVVVAVSGGRVLLQPRQKPCGGETQISPPEIREIATGNIVTTFAPAGEALAVGLDGATAVLLVRTAQGGKRIERYDAGTGALLGSTWVSPATASELDIGVGGIVFRTGREIRLMDPVTGAKRLIWKAAVVPIGLSIEGRRVAWAVNRHGKGYIRAITLPQ